MAPGEDGALKETGKGSSEAGGVRIGDGESSDKAVELPIGTGETRGFAGGDKVEAPRARTFKSVRSKLLAVASIIIILVVAAIIAYPKIFKKDRLEKLRMSGEKISIAVMPFQNMTNDTLWNVWQGGIQDILINSLSNSEELKVRQADYINKLVRSEGIVNYASLTPMAARTISRKLDAKVMINGNIKQAGYLT